MTQFSLTFDSYYQSLVLVAGEKILDDVTDIRVSRASDGQYECEVTRAGADKPVRLVASSSPSGKRELTRATAHLSSEVPGFVEVSSSPPRPLTPTTQPGPSLAEQIQSCFGCDSTGEELVEVTPTAPAAQPGPSVSEHILSCLGRKPTGA